MKTPALWRAWKKPARGRLSGVCYSFRMDFTEKLLLVGGFYLSFCFLKGLLQGLLAVRPRQHVSAHDASREQLRRQALQERIAARRAGRLIAADVLERRKP